VRVQAPPGFGGNVDGFTDLAAQSRQQLFAAAIAVNIGRVKEVDT